MSRFAASFFDGKSAAAHAVEVRFEENRTLTIWHGDALLYTFTETEYTVESRLGNAPRRIHFVNGAHCEIADNDVVDAALKGLGKSRAAAFRHFLESHWQWAALAVVVTALFAWAVFVYGVPMAAERVAFSLPSELDRKLGGESLEILDRLLTSPSELPVERQAELRENFQQFLKTTDDSFPYSIQFRASKRLGANALALPSGIIVMTDDLVRLAESDDELIAVFAHECGHILKRHSIRAVLQNSAFVLAAAFITGDATGIAAVGTGVPMLLLEMRFSRDFEREADDFAVTQLLSAKIDPQNLATILERLEKSHTDTEDSSDGVSIRSYISTHPKTEERMERIRHRAASTTETR